ncbi:MAG: phage tail protein [Methylocystis sp.]|uniref:phage tail protein n=1 Tax=Methylocystis sp. TaxID=1911079 RepID=UPI003DA4D3A6
MADKLRTAPDFYRSAPYPAFRYYVDIVGVTKDVKDMAAGFSDVSGLAAEVNFSEYRPGNYPQLMTLKIPNTTKFDDVVFKRGLIGAGALFEWVRDYFTKGIIVPRAITVTILDEKGDEGVSLELSNALPKKWVGPTLAGKGGGEVAMEELHLVHHGLTWA